MQPAQASDPAIDYKIKYKENSIWHLPEGGLLRGQNVIEMQYSRSLQGSVGQISLINRIYYVANDDEGNQVIRIPAHLANHLFSGLVNAGPSHGVRFKRPQFFKVLQKCREQKWINEILYRLYWNQLGS